MRFVLDATPAELLTKSGDLVRALAERFAGSAPDLADALEKAVAPKAEGTSPVRALHDIHKTLREEYARTLDAMLNDIGDVLDRAADGPTFAKADDGDDDLRKAYGVARGGKYIRREPYTDSSGTRRWRYWYAESASAREATAGTEIRLGEHVAKVVAAQQDGTLILEINGAQETVAPHEWFAKLTQHYGQSYLKSVERRAMQTVSAVSRVVPRALLTDLKGESDAERLAELAKRVPDVYARLQDQFHRSGMGAFEAKRSLEHILGRRRWEPDARAAAIGTVIQHREIGARELVSASESLAGGLNVTALHVQAVVALRAPNGHPEAFPDSVAETSRSAEAELANLSKALSQAQSGQIDPGQALAQALASEAIQKLNLLAKAFPGLKDTTIAAAQQALAAVGMLSPPHAAPVQTGGQTVVYVSGQDGRPQAMAARYRLIEASSLVASHDPMSFQKRPDYPEDVQERAYHRDQAEQFKVSQNAQNLDPRFVVNTNPDAVNGPPMIMPNGVVLGGNSRAMSMQRIYKTHPEKATQLRAYLQEHAYEVGFHPEDVAAFKDPVLVREVDVPDQSKHGLQLLVRQMNESFTQAMDPRTMQVALGRRLTDETLAALAAQMQDDETLSAFLDSSRAESFTNALSRAGVIDNRNVSQYMRKGTRLLNEDGKALVARILVGRTVNNADILSSTGAQTLDSIARSVPFLTQARVNAGDEYDVSADLAVAIDALNDLQRKASEGTIRAVDANISEKALRSLYNEFNVLPGIGEPHPILKNERAQVLLEVLIRKRGPVQMANVFREYARIAKQNPAGQTTMFGTHTSGIDALRQALKGGGAEEATKKALEVGDLEKAGGPYIGPRGGKWADPEHTVAWQDPEDASHNGVYRYGAALRPVSYANVPKGATHEPHKDFRHGQAVYDHPLTPAEIESYELTPILNDRATEQRVARVLDELHEYADQYRELLKEDPRLVAQVVRQALERQGPANYDVAVAAQRVLEGLQNISNTSALVETPKIGDELHVKLHPKVFGDQASVAYYVAKVADGQVQLTRDKDLVGNRIVFGPKMPVASLKHFVNDLEGKVDVSSDSGNADIDAVASGKATFLGKGDDGLAFRSGNNVVKVSTTVPYQPDNPGHRSPEQAIEMLRKQTEVGNHLSDLGIPGIQRSEFVKHGDKGFQIKPWVEIPSKFTREQLDHLQDTLIGMHKAGYALHDDVQAGLDAKGQPVMFDVGKADKRDTKADASIYSEIRGDMDRMAALYRASGEEFVRRDVDEGEQEWARAQKLVDDLSADSNTGYVESRVQKAAEKRRQVAKATLQGKAQHDALQEIEFSVEDALADIRAAAKNTQPTPVNAEKQKAPMPQPGVSAKAKAKHRTPVKADEAPMLPGFGGMAPSRKE